MFAVTGMLFKELVDVFESLKKTQSRLEKTSIIAAFIVNVPADELPIAVTFLVGRVFPPRDERKIGIASQAVIKIISGMTYNSEEQVIESYKKTEHLGITAEEMFQKRRQQTFFEPEDISVKDLYDTFAEIAKTSGAGPRPRSKILMGLLHRGTPNQ